MRSQDLFNAMDNQTDSRKDIEERKLGQSGSSFFYLPKEAVGFHPSLQPTSLIPRQEGDRMCGQRYPGEISWARKFASKPLTVNVFAGCLERRQAMVRYYGLGSS